jgi:dihydrofolate synthase/folylpolyglutamate synthase
MTYEEALAYIDGLLARAQPHPGPDTIKLHRAEELLRRLGAPHRAMPTVLIAGTKGKGSTATMLASIMQAAGYDVGLYTKPHLVDYRERIGVNGAWIAPGELAALVEAARPQVEAMGAEPLGLPSYFELSVALAFQHFARAQVELAIVEVGLGGRLDATNVADPVVSVITPISYDHVEVLGDTLDAIAREKAGIIRPQGVVVSAPQSPEARAAIIDVCTRRGARLVLVDESMRWKMLTTTLHEQTFELAGPRRSYGPLRLPLIGAHQLANAATAVAVVEALEDRGFRVAGDTVAEGLAAVRWPAREEVLHERPYVIVDVAHNPASLGALRETLEAAFPGRRLILVFGMVATHDHRACTSLIAPLADITIVTTPQHLKPLPARVLAEEVARYCAHVEVVEDRQATIERALALAGPEDVVVVTGSFFLVGEVREMLQRRLTPPSRAQVPLG